MSGSKSPESRDGYRTDPVVLMDVTNRNSKLILSALRMPTVMARRMPSVDPEPGTAVYITVNAVADNDCRIHKDAWHSPSPVTDLLRVNSVAYNSCCS